MHRNHSQHQQFWGKQVRQSQVRDKSPVTPRYASGELRRSVYERDAGQCQYCGIELTYETCQLDHVVPWPKGGAYGHIYFPNGSHVWAIAEGGSIVRSNTPSVVFSDEAAYQNEFDDAYTAALPAISGGGPEGVGTLLSQAVEGHHEMPIDHDGLALLAPAAALEFAHSEPGGDLLIAAFFISEFGVRIQQLVHFITR